MRPVVVVQLVLGRWQQQVVLLLQLHALQVGEMAASLGTASPAVVIGDFNAQPGSPAAAREAARLAAEL